MFRSSLLFLLLLLTTRIHAQALPFEYDRDFAHLLTRTQDRHDTLSQARQLPRFLANDTTLTDQEVLTLMIGCTGDTAYHPYGDLEKERNVFSLNERGEFRAAISVGRSFNHLHPLNQGTLIELAFAYYKIDKTDSSDYFHYQFQRVMNAMAWSGKGWNPDSAFFALTPVDGQNFIVKFLGGRIGTMGSRMDGHGRFLDVLEYIPLDEQGEPKGAGRPLYFQIDHAMKELHEQLGNGAEKLNKQGRKKGQKDK